MLVHRDLIGAVGLAVLRIDAHLTGLCEVKGVCREDGLQRVARQTLDDGYAAVLGGHTDQHVLQVTVGIERVCVVDRLIVLVDAKRDGIGVDALIDRIRTTLGSGMDIAVHGCQAEGCDGCVVIVNNLT